MNTSRQRYSSTHNPNSRPKSSYTDQQRATTSERRRIAWGTTGIIAAGAVAIVASALSTGESTRSEKDIIACAKENLAEAQAKGVETAALSDGALAQFAADCDPSSVDPLSPVRGQEYYIELADELRP